MCDSKLYEVMGVSKPLFFEFWKEKPRLDPQRARQLLRGIEAYYKSHGFYHTRAKMFLEKERIVIEIDEGLPIKITDISLISKLDLTQKIPFEKGDIFDPETFVASKKSIKRLYTDHHYCNVFLDAKAFVDIETNLAYLVYDVHPNQPCRFGAITIKTPSSIDPKIIASLLYFKEGDLYSTERIRRSYRELYAHEGIERVIIDDRTHQGEKVPVHIKVSVYERPVHMSAGAGYSTDEGINLQTTLKHRNFFGNLKTLALEAKYSQIEDHLSLSTNVPLKHHNVAAGALALQREIFDGFEEQRMGATFHLKQLRQPNIFQESIVIDHIETRDSQDLFNFPNRTIFLVSPRFAWQIDTRNSLLDPTTGYRLMFESMGSIKSAISDATYYKITLSAAYDRSMQWGVASARINLGSIDLFDGDLPPSYRFYAGGMHSNRGWHYRQLGEKNRYGENIGAFSIAEGSLEARIPWKKNFKWVLFGDVTFLSQNLYPDFSHAYLSVGPGFRYVTPMGPIGLDIGVSLSEWGAFAIHFHIGELF